MQFSTIQMGTCDLFAVVVADSQAQPKQPRITLGAHKKRKKEERIKIETSPKHHNYFVVQDSQKKIVKPCTHN